MRTINLCRRSQSERTDTPILALGEQDAGATNDSKPPSSGGEPPADTPQRRRRSWLSFIVDRTGKLQSWDQRLNHCDEPIVQRAIEKRDVSFLAPGDTWSDCMNELKVRSRAEFEVELPCDLHGSRVLPILLFQNAADEVSEEPLVHCYVGPSQRSGEVDPHSGEVDRRLRMEVLGELAAGLAHDLRNYLTVATGAFRMLESSDRSGQRWSEVAGEAVERAARLSTHMINFGRPQSGSTGCDVETTIQQTLEIARGALPKIQVEVEVSPDLHLVESDHLLLESVLLNLLLNARDAMPAGGNVRISAHNLRSYALGLGGSPGVVNERVQIRFADDGPGIEEDLLQKIFEPYVTTKSRRKGAGLGLSSARRLIHSVGGHIEVSSRLGEGTTFVLTLPALAAATN